MSIFGTGAGNLGNLKRTREQTVTCIAQTEVSTKTQNPTCNPEQEGWEQNNYPEQKSESVPSHMLRCRGSCTWGSVGRLASSLRRPTCPFQGRLKSGDPSKEERLGHKGPFQSGQDWAISGEDRWAGGGGPGSAGRQRGAVPPLLELGLTEAWERGLSSLLRPRPCTAGRPQGRALIVPVSPRHPGGSAGPQRSWRHLRVDAGSPRPVREPGLSPSCLTASSRPRNPTPATCVVPLLD